MKQLIMSAMNLSMGFIPQKRPVHQWNSLSKVTGYVRGGCSPLGMKKLYPTIIQESAETFDMIYVSGGRIGSTIKVNPQELARVVNAKFADFIVC